MQINHANPETPYGIIVVGGKEILTIADTHRFLLSWSTDRIQQTIKIRFGGAFTTPLYLKGVIPVHDEFLLDVLNKVGFDRLLCIQGKKAWIK